MVRAEATRQASGGNDQGNVQVQTLSGATLVTPNQPAPAPTAPAAAPVIIM